VSDHISRKELKQDKIKETIEHGAEAVISHAQFTLIVVSVALVVALGYGGWRVYVDRQTVEASAAFDTGMKAYQGRIGATADPADPREPVYPDEPARVQDALQKFTKVANKYPHTNPGRLARYYSALCLEDLERHNQAIEELKKISGGSDQELTSMAQYQTAVIYSRTGKPDDAVKIFRALAAAGTCRHPSQLRSQGGRQHLPANQEGISRHHDRGSGRPRPGPAFAKILTCSALKYFRGSAAAYRSGPSNQFPLLLPGQCQRNNPAAGAIRNPLTRTAVATLATVIELFIRGPSAASKPKPRYSPRAIPTIFATA